MEFRQLPPSIDASEIPPTPEGLSLSGGKAEACSRAQEKFSGFHLAANGIGGLVDTPNNLAGIHKQI